MPEPEVRTKLAKLQQELAWMTGLSIATYQRLERGDLWNPPLRYLVNCALALDVDLDDVIDDEWRTWHPFSARAKDPPEAGWFQ